MPHAVIVGDVDRRRTRRQRLQRRRVSAAAIAVEEHDRAEAGPGGPEQTVAVLPGRAERPLVGEHPTAGTRRFQPHAREEATLAPLRRRAGQPVALLVRVDGRPGVPAQRPIAPPGDELARRPAVSLVGRVAEFLARQVDPDEVARVARRQALALLGRDDVVGRADHRGDVPDRLGVVTERTERADDGHGTPILQSGATLPDRRRAAAGQPGRCNFPDRRGVMAGANGRITPEE